MKKNSPRKVAQNNPDVAGLLAGKKRLFGDYLRYAVYPVHTRFDSITWFVADAYLEDEITGKPAVIRKGVSEEEVIAGLE